MNGTRSEKHPSWKLLWLESPCQLPQQLRGEVCFAFPIPAVVAVYELRFIAAR
jgi:hypothetical protein